jgi:FkbM family methyltransferase
MIPDELRLRARRLAGAALPEPLFRVLRRRRVAAMVDRYPTHVVTRRCGGVELKVLLGDPLAERWYDLDWDALPEFELLRGHGLGPGARVLDLGAHQGVVALILASLVGDTGEVVAVEAGAYNARIAERNRDLNGASNLTILHAAAGDGATPTLSFFEDLNGRILDRPRVQGRGVVEVPAVSVDGLAARYGRPDVVVIDVEGFEHRVLAGAVGTLAAARSSFMVEVHAGCGLERLHGSVSEVLARFPAERYELFVAPHLPDRTFVSLQQGKQVTGDRFFLVAVPARVPGAADGQ